MAPGLHSCPASPPAFILSTAPHLDLGPPLFLAAIFNPAPPLLPAPVTSPLLAISYCPLPCPCLKDHIRGLRVVPQSDPVPVGASFVVVIRG